ncbi:hypothetical protein ACQSMD_04210 [Streptomyces flavovirens]|uniref:hypothetical protein n=1 Tax=Streptomyces flavovirens TaxID=52258 RepID=UPI003D144DB1
MDTTPSTPVTHDDHDEEGKTTTEEKAAPAPTGTAAPSDAPEDAVPDSSDEDSPEPDPYDEAEAAASTGAGTGAAAVVSAGLGVVSLCGAWTGRVAAERETLIGQIQTSSGGSAAQQISEIYGDAWHTTAFVNGLFALLALLVGVFVLLRPAFGTPSAQPQPGWIRSVARAGIALGTLGVLISLGMYFDLFLAMPSAG